MKKIKEIMKKEIALYKEWKKDDDDSLCYDEAYTLFSGLDRGQCQDIMEELIKDEQKGE